MSPILIVLLNVLIVNRSIVSPTLNVNPHYLLFFVDFSRDYRYLVLQLLSLIK